MSVEDISNKLTLQNGWTLVVLASYKFGKLCLASFTVRCNAADIKSAVFNLDDSIIPLNTMVAHGVNEVTGGSYVPIVDKNSKNIRFASVGANNTYTAGQAISGFAVWITT